MCYTVTQDKYNHSMTLPKTTKDLKIGSNSIIVQSILLF